MPDSPQAEDTLTDAETPAGPPPPRRGPGHRAADARDTAAEMAARAHEISLEAGSKMAGAMREVIGAAAGLSAFAIESARDLVHYMVRRGQMGQEEAEQLIAAAEGAYIAKHGSLPKPEPKAAPAKPVPLGSTAKDQAASAAARAPRVETPVAPPAPVREPAVVAEPAVEAKPTAKAAAPKAEPKVEAKVEAKLEPKVAPKAAVKEAPAPVPAKAAPAVKAAAPAAKAAAAPAKAAVPAAAPAKAPAKSAAPAKVAPPVKAAPAKVAAKPAAAAPKPAVKAPAKPVAKAPAKAAPPAKAAAKKPAPKKK